MIDTGIVVAGAASALMGGIRPEDFDTIYIITGAMFLMWIAFVVWLWKQ